MIRSAEHVTWEAAMERGARDAELRVIADIMQPVVEATRKIGLGFKEAGERMSRSMAAYGRAMELLSGRPEDVGG